MTIFLYESFKLGSAASQIQFSGIPQDANTIIFEIDSRVSDENADCFLFVNGSTGPNYDYEFLESEGSARTPSGAEGQNSIPFWSNRNSSISNSFAFSRIILTNYSFNTDKSLEIESYSPDNSTSQELYFGAARISITETINTVTFSTSTANFLAGTRISLYKEIPE